MEQIFDTANLVQAGAVVIALVALWFNYKIVSNHINHNTEASTKLSEAIKHLMEFLENKFR